MHLHRTDPDDLVGLLSLDDADHLLTSTAIRTPAIRLAQDGAVLPESSYTRSATLAGKPLTGLVDARKALALFDGGATIVFQGLQRYWPPLTRLIAELELELGHPCQANAYLTPPGSQGFAVHSDSHDVFVFQTAGSKLWEVHGADGPEEVLLEPGLSMYLPTGTPHAARAQETVSLHVTLGINQLTWRGLVERAVGRCSPPCPTSTCRPATSTTRPCSPDALADRLEELAADVRRVDATAAVEDEIRRFLTTPAAAAAGGLHDVLGREAIDATTRLRRRPGHPCVLLDRGDQVEVLLGDRSLTMPGPGPPGPRRGPRARRAHPRRPAARPAERLVLCRRLVREGLLEIA